jgi:hypothetical protein
MSYAAVVKLKRPKEDPRVKFRRIAVRRLRKLLKDVDTLSNCSRRPDYSYSDVDRERMFAKLRKAVDTAEAKFMPSYKNEDEFSF